MPATPINPLTPFDLAPFYDGSASQDRQQGWLDRVWRALLAEVPTLADRVDDPALLDLAKDAVVAATLRVLRNPEGFTQESGGIDDYQESWQRANATEDIFFNAAELRRLAAPSATNWTNGWSGSIAYVP